MINIRCFSFLVEDFNLFKGTFKDSSYEDLNFILCQGEDITTHDDEILILKCSNPGYFPRFIELKSKIKNQIIFLVSSNDIVTLRLLIKNGFTDFFVFPDELTKVYEHVKEIIKQKTYVTSIDFKENTENFNTSFEDIIGTSTEIKKIIEFAKRAAENKELNILILGETGTGKGLLAKSIHKYSNEPEAPFIDIICTAIPENLMESELFGYEKGAFTNAIVQKIGLVEAANNGTLFLDEIGDLTLNFQAKLLRVIDRKVIRRLGGLYDIPINSRIVSATNRDLEFMLEANMFRRDLYHRLNVVSIELPPLRMRTEDIIPLANYFIEQYNKRFGKEVMGIDNEFKEFALNYSWPGNIREFKNTIERSILLCDSNKLRLSDFLNFNSIIDNLSLFQENSLFFPHLIRMDLNYKDTNLKTVNKVYAKKILVKMRGNKSKTSKILGISRPKLDSLLK